MGGEKPKLYCSWFCPFAQRAWIALLEKGVDFEYVEVNPYNKTKEWLSISPRGLVPTIVHNGKSVYESAICIEYVDDAWPGGTKLLPGTAFDKARQRLWAEHISKNFTPSFYPFLMSGSSHDREQLMGAVKDLAAEMDPIGPFFSGDKLSYVDIMLIPFALTFEILDHYRGFKIPKDGAVWQRYHQWFDAAKQCPSVVKTLPDKRDLREYYRTYAH